jgi:glycosyltransferase involved in cell wall biosynthesis
VADDGFSFCMLTTFYPPYHFGGDAMYVYRLSNALARRGHRVTVIHNVEAYRALRRTEPEGAFTHEPGVTVKPLRSRAGPLSPLVTYLAGRPGLAAPALDEIFERERFDIVHFHNISLMGGPGVLSYGDGIKLYTMHEHWLVCPMHVLWKYNRRPCERPQCLRCTLTFRRPPQLWRYTGLLERQLDQVDIFLAPSRFTAEKHRERGFTRNVRHLPYFVPEPMPPPPDPSESPASPSRPYFLFVGRLERLKGLHTLIDVFQRYDAADLLVAGDGNFEVELRQQAAGTPHVRFLGRVHPSTLGGLYDGAIALLLPTVGYEVFAFVSLEALSRGLPVIVRDLGGQREAVEDSGAGFTYGTDAELLDAMERLRVDPTLRGVLGERGRRAFRELWSEEVHLERYLAMIDELSSTRSPVSAER